MSQGRTPTNDGSGRKANESAVPSHQSPPVGIDAVESNGDQTLLSFSGIGVDAVLAVPESELTLEEAHEIAHEVVDAAGGVA